MSIRKLAKKLPYPIKQGLKYVYSTIPLHIRYGKVFRETYRFLQESQWWSKERLENYQLKQLEKLLNHAYKNVPYYRKIFDERGLKPKNIQCFDDLRKLPYLTKDIFKQHFGQLIAKNLKLRGLSITHTSGTSGKPLQFYQDASEKSKEWAFVCHQWHRVGYKPRDARVELRGAIIESKKLIDYDHIERVLRLSPRIDNKDVATYYVEKIRQFGARFLHGYPSSIAQFAFMIKQHRLCVPFRLKAVLFASETVYPWERQVVEEIFECQVFSFYGMTEHVVMAAECEHNHHYHCIPQYGMTEIEIDTNEIIGTSFLNYVNPFIRYKTTDIASEPVSLGCSECGRQYYPIFSGVQGRMEDFVVTPEGVPISPAVITHPFKGFKTIRNTQIIQKSLDCIKLRIVPWDDYNPKILKSELQELCQGLQNILTTGMKIDTEVVESVQLSKSGKFKWIISEVSKGILEEGFGQSSSEMDSEATN